MENGSGDFVTSVAIITRRLKKGKTYEDFRKAWYHTTGFGIKGNTKGASNRMYSLVNVFDPREIVVLGFATTTLKQLKSALEIDVKYRGQNPLDAVIEPEIGRKFCALVAEDDFSDAGKVPYKPARVGGKRTEMAKFKKNVTSIRKLYTAAAAKREKVNAARKRASP